MIADVDILKRIACLVGDKEFVYDSNTEKWLTYNDVWIRAYTIAGYFRQQGMKTVIAVMKNGIELFTLYFACMLSGTVVIPIDPQKSPTEIDSIISEHGDAVILKDESEIFALHNTYASVDAINKAIRQIDLNKLFMITYTSGSTGHAKGVMHNLRNLFLTAKSFGEATGLNDRFTMGHVMPMTYMAGILNTIVMPFWCGTKIVLLPRFDVMSAIKFWKNSEKLHVNAFWLAPTMLNLLMTIDKKAKAKEYLSSVDTRFYIGTAPLLESTRQKFEEKYGVKLLQSYGLSETLFISTELPEDENDFNSVGKLLPEVQIDTSCHDEIRIDVPWMFLGYSNENTSDYFEDNKYKSGDLGKVDNQNRLYITGRIKDLIVKGGMNISPTQIEKSLTRYEQISECAVAGVMVKEEENIACWYVLKKDLELSHVEVNNLLEKELGRHCRIDFFRQINEIPKNLNGKIDKKKLVREFTL